MILESILLETEMFVACSLQIIHILIFILTLLSVFIVCLVTTYCFSIDSVQFKFIETATKYNIKTQDVLEWKSGQ
jgi:hypothetical protein